MKKHFLKTPKSFLIGGLLLSFASMISIFAAFCVDTRRKHTTTAPRELEQTLIRHPFSQTMEVRTNGIMASNSETHLANGGSNKENPWDFIEKEILEFQSIVKELEDYSMNSKYLKNRDIDILIVI